MTEKDNNWWLRIFKAPDTYLLKPITALIHKISVLLKFELIQKPLIKNYLEPILKDMMLKYANEIEIANQTIDPFNATEKPQYIEVVKNDPECFPDILKELHDKYHEVTFMLAIADIAEPWIQLVKLDIKNWKVKNWSNEKYDSVNGPLLGLKMLANQPKLRKELWKARAK